MIHGVSMAFRFLRWFPTILHDQLAPSVGEGAYCYRSSFCAVTAVTPQQILGVASCGRYFIAAARHCAIPIANTKPFHAWNIGGHEVHIPVPGSS